MAVQSLHRIVRILYHLITTRQQYDGSVFAVMKQHAQQRQLSMLKRHASTLGFQPTPTGCVP